MNITTTLAQSKRLKELGAPAETIFSWINVFEYGPQVGMSESSPKSRVICRCYTLSELIDWLGGDFQRLEKTHMDGNSSYVCDYTHNELGDGKCFYGPTPIDALVALAEAIKQQS